MKNKAVAENRIVFPGNPWPNGHKIKEFVWQGSFDPELGLLFTLSLETEDYNAEGPGIKGDGDFGSPLVWNNYHRCSLSDNACGFLNGFVVGTESDPFDFEGLANREFVVDSEPIPEIEERVFGIYLLGHDGVGDHRIKFTRASNGSGHMIDWRGKIALEYAGEQEFAYSFHARLSNVEFQGFSMPKGTDSKAAIEHVAPFFTDIDRWIAKSKNNTVWISRKSA